MLADGSSWVVVPGDEGATHVVETLAAVMRLSDDTPKSAAPARELRVITSESADCRVPPDTRGDGPVRVCVFPSTDRAMHMIAVERVAQAMARDAQRRGGLLIHGALAEWRGCGFILAGAGTVGKSTASRRLPAPCRSWCDDATLVVRDDRGRFRAHPWPTWSRFYQDGEGGSWDTAASLPLAAVFFLSQAPDDAVTPIQHPAQAIAMALECVSAVSSGMRRGLEPDQTRALSSEQLANVEALVAATPTFGLQLCLTGSFWTLLEPHLEEALAKAPQHADFPRSADDGDVLIVALSGTSMLPTLREPELLEIASLNGRSPRVGDILYFRSPKDGIMVVHRAVSVSPHGVRTRGDNCTGVDPWVLGSDDILGRVVGVRHGTKRRPVAGGKAGRAVAVSARARRGADRAVSPRLHAAYVHAAESGVARSAWTRLAPPHLQPCLVRFGEGPLATEKVLVGGREVARYDRIHQKWTIQRPYRLLVDEAALPLFPRPDFRSRIALQTDDGEGEPA